MKHLFLDIDGVLNSSVYFRSDYYKQTTAGISNAEVMLIAHHHHLDPQTIELLNDLIDRSGAQVILSSTWRLRYDPQEMTKMMQGRGFKHQIAAYTPAIREKMSSQAPRGKEISSFLNDLPEQSEQFVILDDRDDMLSLKKHLVQTNVQCGLTTQDVTKALKILNGELD